MSREFFDWNDIEDDIVVPEQAAIAVYDNPKGGVVCRQAGQFGSDEDHWIYFHPRYAVEIAKAILEKAGRTDLAIVDVSRITPQARRELVGGGSDMATEPKPDRTAAERQRRRREKQRERDGHAQGTVTAADRRGSDRDIDAAERDATPLIPEFDLQNGGSKALAN